MGYLCLFLVSSLALHLSFDAGAENDGWFLTMPWFLFWNNVARKKEHVELRIVDASPEWKFSIGVIIRDFLHIG
jgi:hypothetical protein